MFRPLGLFKMFDKVYAFTYLRLNLPFISRREKLGAPGELFLYDPASGCINGVNWEVVHLQEAPFPFDWTRTGKRVSPTLHIHSDLARHCRLHERKCHLNLFYPPARCPVFSTASLRVPAVHSDSFVLLDKD